jgi:hypothetical protein
MGGLVLVVSLRIAERKCASFVLFTPYKMYCWSARQDFLIGRIQETYLGNPALVPNPHRFDS